MVGPENQSAGFGVGMCGSWGWGSLIVGSLLSWPVFCAVRSRTVPGNTGGRGGVYSQVTHTPTLADRTTSSVAHGLVACGAGDRDEQGAVVAHAYIRSSSLRLAAGKA